jgi:hypothetical protein
LELAKRWRWLGIEFVVIVLGVLSALFVDTWVEDRENAERAEVYRQRLITDIQQDIVNLDAVMAYFTQVRNYGLLTLKDLEGRERMDDFNLMFAAFNAAEEWGFELQSSTFVDMQSTGGLALFEDVELRLELAGYHRQASNVADVWDIRGGYREAARGIIPNKLQAAIHENCSVEPLHAESWNLIGLNDVAFSAAILPQNPSATAKGLCGLDQSEFDLKDAAEELRSDPEIARHLRFRVSEVRVSIALFEGQRVLAEKLLSRLSDEA